MDCPYCGKTIDDGGFICASCSASEKTVPVVSIENDSVEKLNSPQVSTAKTAEIESKSPIPIALKKESPKLIAPKAEQLPTTIEATNSQIDTEKNQVKEKISLSEPTQPSLQTKRSDKWKNSIIHPDLAPATSVLLITLFLLFVCSFLFILMLIVLENGPKYAAVITGLIILLLLVLPIFIQLDEMRVAKWKRFASWVYNNGSRDKATYEIKVNPNNHGAYIKVRILKVHGGSIKDSELSLLSKAPRKLVPGFTKAFPYFIPSSETIFVSEADIIYDPDTIKHVCILEKDGHRLWLSTTKFNAPV